MRKKFAWFFCIFMSSLVLLSCSEDNKKGEEPGDGIRGKKRCVSKFGRSENI